jgi:demethylmenaquinone methyltransferase/2-methoxy-6-polyprenyl-1,4-benzoquinol methylase
MPAQELENPNQFARTLFAPIPKHYERLAELLSLGQNSRWRRAMIDHIVGDQPELVLDVASGPAGVALQLAERSEARVVGIDLTFEMLKQGERAISQRGLADRIQLVNGLGEQMPFADSTFDALTFTYLLRYVDDPEATLHELARVVRPGGAVANMEFLLPESRFWRFWWWGFTRLLLPVGGWLTGGREWFEVGRFLGPNISAHYKRYPLSWTVKAWKRAGFVEVGVRRMSLGGGLVMWGRVAGE